MNRLKFVMAAAAAGIASLALAPLAASGQPQGFTFAMIGDLGYYEQHEPWVDNVHAEIAKDKALSFVVHVGDLSRPVRACSEALLKHRLAQFNGLRIPSSSRPATTTGPTVTTSRA